MSAAGIHSWSGVRRLACAASALATLALPAGLAVAFAAIDPALAQTNRQQREIRDNSREIQQQLRDQQRDQQLRFDMNQLRDQQLRQQQFQPLPPPSINMPPPVNR